MPMKKKRDKRELPLRLFSMALIFWAAMMSLAWCVRRQGGGTVLFLSGIVLLLFAYGAFRLWQLGRITVLRRGCAIVCAAALCLSVFPASALAAVSGSLSDPDIGISDSMTSGTAPSDGDAGGSTTAGWTASGTTLTGIVTPGYTVKTTTSSCGSTTTTYHYYTGATTTLTLTNNSGEEAILAFDYTAASAGSLTIDGTAKTANGSFSKSLAAGNAVTVVLTTPASASSTSSESASTYAAATTLSSISLTPANVDVTVTLNPVSVGGSYTAKVNSTNLTVGQSYEYPATTSYTFTAVANVNYQFDGWYVNNTKVADTATYTRTFSADAAVEARFVQDPLYSIVSVTDGAGEASAFLEINSAYYHLTTGNARCRHTNVGDLNTNNSYGAMTYFPYLQWSASGSALQSSWSGVVTGDNQTSLGYSNARAWLYSDVIRVKAIQACTITFDFGISASRMDSSGDYPNAGTYAYTYVTTSASASTSTITSNGTLIAGGAGSGSGSASQEISLNAGEYLYIYSLAETLMNSMKSSGYCTDNTSYSATISNFTVAPNDTTYNLTLSNRDNIGTLLSAGSIKVNGVERSVSSGPYAAQMAGASVLTLTPGTAPSGYTFIGWHNATTDTYIYTDTEYTITMTGDADIYALYVPAMTITTGGANGYEGAAYTYRNLGGSTVTPNGQYVARNADCTAFYATLNEAFSGTDTVVLLAGDTISGDLTIPAGKTLVIPCGLADPGSVEPAQVTATTTMTNYCAVSYDNGTLTVNGTLVVSAVQSGAAPQGISSGPIGYLKLGGSARMTVNGTLSVSGLIRGGEQIAVNSGGTVYELMVIADFRSLLLTESFISDKQVFPFNNFYIKNIEDVEVTYQTGSNLYARYSMRLQGMTVNTTGLIPVIGTSGALFNITEGSFTKMFDRSTDKTIYRLDENSVGSSGSFSLTMTYSMGGLSQTMTVNTADYFVPLNAGFDIQVNGQFTINSDFKFLPGANLSVGENGVCTIASGKNVVLYRLNDYDIRSGGSGNEYRGFSSSGYPVSARNYPAGGYSHPTINTVGSARLNVDGQMIVLGGLYVTDMLCADAYATGYKDNGYNVLTGTGAIDYTNAASTITYVEEGMQASGSNDPQYVQVTITPVAGLPVNVTVDAPDLYEDFAYGSIYYGAYLPYDGGIYVWSTTPFSEVAVIIGEGNDDQSYISLANAVAAYAGTGYIKMIDNSTEAGFSIDKDVYLDLNGCTVTSDLTVAGGYTLYGMDSATDGYDDSKAGSITGTVTGTVAPVVETNRKADSENSYYRYVTVTDDGGISFHRFNISISGYRFELSSITPECALFFLGTFRGDNTARNYLTSVGFELSNSDGTPLGAPTFTLPDTDIPDVPADGGASESEVVFQTPDAYLFEAYLIRALSENNYRSQFGAVGTVKFDNGGSWASEERKLSYLEAWQNVTEVSEEDKARLNAFLTKLGENTIN